MHVSNPPTALYNSRTTSIRSYLRACGKHTHEAYWSSESFLLPQAAEEGTCESSYYYLDDSGKQTCKAAVSKGGEQPLAAEDGTAEPSQALQEEAANASQAAGEEPDATSSPQSPGSDVSLVTPERRLDERKQEIIDAVVLYATERLRLKLARIRSLASGSDHKSESAGGSSNLVPDPAKLPDAHSNNAGNKRKRRAATDDAADSDIEDGDDSKHPDRAEPSGSQKFACPYFKYNPVKYRDWRICPGPGWPDVHRVKYVLPKPRCIGPRFLCKILLLR